MAALLGGASGAAGAGAMGAAGTGAAAPAATGAMGAAGTAGTYASGFTPASADYGAAANYAPAATYAAPGATGYYPTTAPVTMSGSEYLNKGPIPQGQGFDPQGAQFQEDPMRGASWMERLMNYAKKHPSNAPDRSMPTGPQAGPPAPPQYSHLLGQSGQYPTLASLMAVQLPTLQTRG